MFKLIEMLDKEDRAQLDKQLASLENLVFDNREHQDRDVMSYGIVIGKYDDLWQLYTDGTLLQRNGWQSYDDLQLDFNMIKGELARVAAEIKKPAEGGTATGGSERVECAQQ